MPAWLPGVLVVCLGLAVGSFLNVCIHRLPLGLSVVRPRSRCPACGAEIRAYHNVPVLGYLVLGGRCADCGTPISLRYPIVEAVTALAFLVCYLHVGLQPLLAARLLFASALIVLFLIDLEHQILPNRITVSGTVLGLVFSFWLEPGWRASVLGILLGGGVLLLIAEAYRLVRRIEGLGMGDVKMLAMIGAFLGWQQVLVTLALSSFAGAAVGLALIASSRGGMRLALPFGTFLAVGAFVASVAGPGIWSWYMSLYP